MQIITKEIKGWMLCYNYSCSYMTSMQAYHMLQEFSSYTVPMHAAINTASSFIIATMHIAIATVARY